MAQRSSVYQTFQAGVETVPGTSVPANKKFATTMLDFGPKFEVQTYGTSGNKYNTIEVLNKEWSGWKVKGPLSYSEISYFLAMFYSQSAATQIGTTGAYTWPITPISEGPDVFKTFTFEKGDATNAEKSVLNFGVNFGYKFDRSNLEFNVDGIGRKIQTGITKTASPATIENKPISGKEVSFFLDTTSAGLGTTKLTGLLSGDFSDNNTKGPAWFVDSAESSFADMVELMGRQTQLKLVVVANTANLGYLGTVGTFYYGRVKAVGANIGVAADYTFQHDMALQLKDVTEFGDKDGLYTFGLTYNVDHDPAWSTGQAHIFSLVNKLTAL